MKRNSFIIGLVLAILTVFGIKTVAANMPNKEEPNKEIITTAKLIEDFYSLKCNGKNACTKCFKDYYYDKEEKTYCLNYYQNKENRLTGQTNCNKKGRNCDEEIDSFIFNNNGKLIEHTYMYIDKTGEPIEVFYKYDSKGRIKKETETDINTGRKSYTIAEYKYRANKQTMKIYKKDGLIKKKAQTDEIKECKADRCKYAQSFLPLLVPPKK